MSFSHTGTDGPIPRKCAFCTRFFEGECLWVKHEGPAGFFTLITERYTHTGKNALQKVLENLSLTPGKGRVLLVIEGNPDEITLAGLNEALEAIRSVINERELAWDFRPDPSLKRKVRVTVIRESKL